MPSKNPRIRLNLDPETAYIIKMIAAHSDISRSDVVWAMMKDLLKNNPQQIQRWQETIAAWTTDYANK